jgi:hypothetical protein
MTQPTLKLVVAWSDRRNLCSTLFDALSRVVDVADIRRVGDDAIIAFSAEDAETLRAYLTPLITPDEGLLITEFEKWSGYGKALDAEWLLARGH